MQLYNTLTRQKEEFQPAGDEVSMYVCGVTVYDYSHVGHALSAITFEVLHRYLEYRGYKVRRVVNFTDVDDKIIARSEREGVSTEEISKRFTEAYLEDMDALNILPPTLYPKATEEIPQIVELISDLIGKGFAYEAEGSVYFRVRNDESYGELSHRTLEDMMQGTRFELESGKEYPADFALWKLSKPGEPAWESPWSKGRPGWHIECSAMAYHHLGDVIDIHGGGLDLIFPHHENEVAQSRAYTGKSEFARFWLHNGMLRLSGEKMSKSTGNIVRVRDALKTHSSDAFRLWIFSSHYRSPLLYEEEGLEAAERAARRLRNALNAPANPTAEEPLDPARYKERFIEAMEDDLNLPQATAALFDLVRDINRSRDTGMDVSGARDTLRELSGVLGLTLEGPAAQTDGPSDAEIEEMIGERALARSESRYEDADTIRDRLDALGISISDSADGTSWSRV
ncbi:MAG: cysteine--tRNA ligase [Chloroflexi bacterium]|nr:cysteine--tRNA ligase [Chloroflexota bacterium]